MSAQPAERPPTVVLCGLPFFIRQLAQNLTARFNWRVRLVPFAPRSRIEYLGLLARMSFHLLGADILHVLGVFPRPERLQAFVNALKIPVVLHWAGTDVLQALQQTTPGSEPVGAGIRQLTHWAVAPWLAKELLARGVHADVFPLPLDTIDQNLSAPPPPLPPEFTIVTYLEKSKPEFYGSDLLLRMARERPDIRIIVVGGYPRSRTSHLPNVTNLGWVPNMRDVYTQSSVVVRMTRHDGYGGTIQEGLALGRYGIWTYPIPGAALATDYDSLLTHVDRLLLMHQRGNLALNMEGRSHIEKNFRPAILTQRISDRLLFIIRSYDRRMS